MTHEETKQDILGKFRDVINTNLPEPIAGLFHTILSAIADSKAPASTSLKRGHGAFEDGLLFHSWRVFQVANSLACGLVSHAGIVDLLTEGAPPYTKLDAAGSIGQLDSLQVASLLKVAILHDLNKLQDPLGRPYYVENLLKSGSRSTDKPWEISEASDVFAALDSQLKQYAPQEAHNWWTGLLASGLITVREGLVGLAVAESIAPGITICLSDIEKQAIIFHDGAYAGRTGLPTVEPLLMIVIHAADMISSRYLC